MGHVWRIQAVKLHRTLLCNLKRTRWQWLVNSAVLVPYSTVSGRSCIAVCTALHRCCAAKCIKSPPAGHSSYARRLGRRDVLRRAIHHDQLQRHSAISSLYRTNASLISAPLDGTPFAYYTTPTRYSALYLRLYWTDFSARTAAVRYDMTRRWPITDMCTDTWTITQIEEEVKIVENSYQKIQNRWHKHAKLLWNWSRC